MSSHFETLVAKLKEILQIDKPELDFGIYRIIGARREQINDFLDNRLAAKVQTTLAGNAAAEEAAVKANLAEAIENAKNLGIENPDDLPKVRELKEKLAACSASLQAENEVYSHLLTFFSRYYDKGDFISQRRYKGDTYAIPYSGEEVKLHWANADQYYIKSGEGFSHYDFALPNGAKVHFRLVSAVLTKDNIKDNECVRCFALWNPDDSEGTEPNTYPKDFIEEKADGLYIYFQYKRFKKKTQQAKVSDETVEKVKEVLQTRWDILARYNILEEAPTEKNKDRTIFRKYLDAYTAKNTSDYFIHKDLKGFLSRELDFYIKNEMMHLDDIQNASAFSQIEKNLRMIQAVRAIAMELIEFMAQIENFQKKLWLKKKFVVSSDWCISLKYIPVEFYNDIIKNKKQIHDWILFFHIDILKGYTEPLTVEFLMSNQNLVIDTKYFDEEFKDKLLTNINDIYSKEQGLLICSENQQALNLIFHRYKSEISAIITDPPYNTDEDDFLYKDDYRDSTWISMMSDRLNLLYNILSSDAWCTININDIELHNLIKLSEVIPWSVLNTICVKMSHLSGMKMSNIDKKLPKIKESIVTCFKGKNPQLNPVYIPCRWDDAFDRYNGWIEYNNSENPEEWTRTTLKRKAAEAGCNDSSSAAYEDFRIKNAEHIFRTAVNDSLADMPRDGIFRLAETSSGLKKIVLNGEEVLLASSYLKEIDGRKSAVRPLSDIWDDIGINNIHNEGGVQLPNGKKPVKLFERLITLFSSKDGYILDPFAGSATIAHAVFNINTANSKNHKFIAIQSGMEYFEKKTKQRVKNIMYSTTWKLDKPQSRIGSYAIIKYITLESYDDTLNNIELHDTSIAALDSLMQEEYLLKYMLDIESRGSIINTDSFCKPFDYKLKIAVDSSGASEMRKVDLVETFNYLLGLHVESQNRNISKGYVTVEGRLSNGKRVLIFWRDCDKINSAELNKELKNKSINPKEKEYDYIYVNGDHSIANLMISGEQDALELKVRSIEEEFLTRMFEEE